MPERKSAAVPRSVTVLLGGINSESEVSLESGRRIMAALESLGYDVQAVYYEGDPAQAVAALAGCDMVFIGLHGGDGEDGTVQAALEKAGLTFTGSGAKASRLAMDKHASKRIMDEAGIATPDWLVLDLPPGAPATSQGLPLLTDFSEIHGFPLVVKPNHEGSTVGVSIAHSQGRLDAALLLARAFGSRLLVEVYIPGRELTVTVLDGRALPVVEIIPLSDFYDYDSKYRDGLSSYVVPADLPQQTTLALQEDAVRLYRALGCRHYSRIDFRLTPRGTFRCLELNTLPGMTAHSLTPMAAQAAGIAFPELVDMLVRMAWSRRNVTA